MARSAGMGSTLPVRREGEVTLGGRGVMVICGVIDRSALLPGGTWRWGGIRSVSSSPPPVLAWRGRGERLRTTGSAGADPWRSGEAGGGRDADDSPQA